MGRIGPFGRRSQAQFRAELWNQLENAKEGNNNTNNSMEGWNSAFQLGMVCAHPTAQKFISFLRREQSMMDSKLIRIRSGEKAPKNPKHEKMQLRSKEVLSHYQNKTILRELKGLSYNFDLEDR